MAEQVRLFSSTRARASSGDKEGCSRFGRDKQRSLLLTSDEHHESPCCMLARTSCQLVQRGAVPGEATDRKVPFCASPPDSLGLDILAGELERGRFGTAECSVH